MDTETSATASPDTATSSVTDTASSGLDYSSTQATSEAPSTTHTSSASPDAPVAPQVGTAGPGPAGKLDQAPAQEQVHDWQKRYNDILPYAQRLQRERDEVAKKYDGLPDPSQIRSILQEHEKRQAAANLKPWNTGHAEFSKFEQVRNKAADFRAKMAMAETPEEKALVQKLYANDFTPEDIRMVKEAEQDSAQLIQRFQSDPRGLIAELSIPLIRQEIQQWTQFQHAQQEVNTFLTNPQNSNLIQRYSEDMTRHMDPSVPAREKAIEVASLKAELDALKAQLGQQVEMQSQREAQQDALGRGPRGSSPRQPNGKHADFKDPVAYLKSKGFEPGTEQFSIQLQKLNKSR